MGKTGKAGRPIWSKNIIARQKALGISSVERLSELADLPYPTVRDIVTGISEGRFENREKLANVLRCTVADFYTGGATAALGKPIPDVHAAVDFLSKFAALPPDLQKIALTVVYQDTSFLRGIPTAVAREMVLEIGRLFLPLQKAGQK